VWVGEGGMPGASGRCWPVQAYLTRASWWGSAAQIANGSNKYGDGVLLLLQVPTDEGLTGHEWLGGTTAERPLEILPRPFGLDEDGDISVPAAPGIGRVPDRAALSRHMVCTTRPE